MPSNPAGDRIYINEAADMLHRQPDTLRKWESRGELPKTMLPKREKNGRKRRYWTPAQIEKIKQWMIDTDRRPGKGLPTYDPDWARAEEVVDLMRGPRGDQSVDGGQG